MNVTVARTSNDGRFVGPASPLADVSREHWDKFCRLLEVQSTNKISESGGFGSYAIRPRRLVELGYAMYLRSKRTDKGRTIQTCEFLPPWTQAKFFKDPLAQYVAFSRSMLLYYTAMASGELKRPAGVSLAGALAILHCGGKGALKAWPEIFSDTKVLYDRVQGLF